MPCRLGVKYVAQPGGSVADAEVIEACNTYGMVPLPEPHPAHSPGHGLHKAETLPPLMQYAACPDLFRESKGQADLPASALKDQEAVVLSPKRNLTDKARFLTT